MNIEKKELIESIFSLLIEREQNIFYQLEDDNIHFIQEINKLEKNADKILKARGILKQEKLKKKALKQLKESAKKIYITVHSSKETYVYHLLLDCITRISYLLKTKCKMLDENDLIFNEDFNIEFTDRILNKVKIIDTRSSNFLKKITKYNDMVINNNLLENKVNESKFSVQLNEDIEIKYLCKEYEFLKEIMKSAIVGSICMEELKFKYEKKEIKEFKYNFSRIKNFVLEIEKELKIFDFLFNCGKYKDIVFKSFLNSDEKMAHESIESYLKYLVWLDKKGKLFEEYELISQK